MRRRPTCTEQGSPSICRSTWYSLSYNELVSAAINQERMMKDVAEVDEKKRKRMTPGVYPT
jgi:hypothetical protein